MSDKIEDLIEKIRDKSSYELYIWILWLINKISCPDCIQACFDKNKLPDCPNCIPASNLIKKSNKALGKRRQKNDT